MYIFAARAPGQANLVSMMSKSKNNDQNESLVESTSSMEIDIESHESVNLDIEVGDEAHELQPSHLTDNFWVRDDEFTKEDYNDSAKNGRYCQAEWFRSYKWLMYNRNKKALFCDICSKYSKEKGTSVFVYKDDVECVGFQNWKKGPEKLSDHEGSDIHRDAMKERLLFEIKIPDVASQINQQFLEQQQLRQRGLLAHLNTLKTLLRQGVAIRGDTDKESNIMQFNLDKSTLEPGLKLLLDDNKYISHGCIEEQEQLIILEVRRKLADEIRRKEFYSIIVDEATDITKTEQLSISIRTCNENYEISEDFIGIRECDQGISSDALLEKISDTLPRLSLVCFIHT